MAALTMEILSQVILGQPLPPDMTRHLTVLQDGAVRMPADGSGSVLASTVRCPPPPNPASDVRRQWHHALDAMLSAIAAQKATGDSLASLLLPAGKRRRTTCSSPDAVQLRDEVAGLFHAGQDATSAALAWILDPVAGHPTVQARLPRRGARQCARA